MTDKSVTPDHHENDRYVPLSNGSAEGWETFDRLENKFISIEEMREIGVERLKNEKLATN